MRGRHHPECRLDSFKEAKARWAAEGLDVSSLPDFEDDAAGFLLCDPECPIHRADMEYARNLALRHGWIDGRRGDD